MSLVLQETSFQVKYWSHANLTTSEGICGDANLTTHILKYLCRVSFLTTLDIYKNYLRAVTSDARWCKKNNTCIVWPEAEIALVHYSLCRSYCIFTPRVLWPRSFLIFTVDELKNFAANNLLEVGKLVTYWDPCIIGKSRTGIRVLNGEIAATIQVQLGIGVRVQL